MASKIDFKKILENQVADFKMHQAIDESGKVVDKDMVPNLSDEQLVELMKQMVWTRVLDQRSIALARQGRLGFYAPTAGEEASQLGSNYAMKKSDYIFPGYRDIPELVFHGLPLSQAFLWSKGHVAGNMYPQDFPAVPPQIIIGAQYIQAMGAGMGAKFDKKDQVIYVYTGDGGTSQGDFYEALNFAGEFKVPVVFIVQNNQFAISVPREKQSAAKTLAQKAIAAGIPGVQVDGMDALAVYEVVKEAREYALAGNGPVLIETQTYRYGPHTLAGDDPTRYRTKEEDSIWEKRDPIIRMRNYLTSKDLWTKEMEDEVIETAKSDIKQAIDEADSVPEQKISEFVRTTFDGNKIPFELEEEIKDLEAKENTNE